MTLYTFFHSNEPLVEAHFPLIFGYVVDHLEKRPRQLLICQKSLSAELIFDSREQPEVARSGL